MILNRGTERTLSDSSGDKRVKRCAETQSGGTPDVMHRAALKCGNPRCRIDADYLIPQGTTPRTECREFAFCIECLELYLGLMKTSIVLPGEDCEWELTIKALENVFDGGRDHLRDLLLDCCGHSACAYEGDETDEGSSKLLHPEFPGVALEIQP